MSMWSRIRNALSPTRVEREIEAELESHREQAREDGSDPRLFGGALRHTEASREAKVAPWLDSLRADAVFAWRQLLKRKTVTTVAVLSLALGTGAVLSAFRLFDAGFLRTLPIPSPERLHFLRYTMLNIDGVRGARDSFPVDEFRTMQAALGGEASLYLASFADRQDITFGGPAEVEKISRQYVSPAMFAGFGIQPAAGRLFAEEQEDPAADHRVAAVSHDFATRRLGGPAAALGRTFQYHGATYTITGVVEPKFTGTTTGAMIDVYLPARANDAAYMGSGPASHRSARVLAYLRDGVTPELAEAKLSAAFRAERERYIAGRSGLMQGYRDSYLDARLSLLPASGGISNFYRDFRVPIQILIALSLLVLLLCCAGVANLLTIQGAARAREMALRTSIGAGRSRLVRMLLVECLMLGGAASALGVLFAHESAPFIVARLNPPDNPLRLQLAMDERVALAAVALTLVITALFGLLPALRASSVSPAETLKEGAAASTGRPARAMVGLQVAFCVVVCFVAGLLASSLRNLDRSELGFDPHRLLLFEAYDPDHPPRPGLWTRLRDRVAEMPGVEAATVSGWPLQTGGANSQPAEAGSVTGDVLLHPVAPGWFDLMRIPLIDGRDFRDGEPGAVIVNEQFARHYFNGRSPLGQSVTVGKARAAVVGVVHDIRVRDLREAVRPTVFAPHFGAGLGVLSVRLRPGVAHGPVMASLRQTAADSFPRLRVDGIRMQEDLIQLQTVRERLVASIAAFFAAVALVLAALGLYGVLAHTVSRRSREIAVRMALGARAATVVGKVLEESAVPLVVGAIAGYAMGRAAEGSLRAFLYEANGADPAVLAAVAVALVVSGGAAAAMPLVRAIRIDPARTLRAD